MPAKTKTYQKCNYGALFFYYFDKSNEILQHRKYF